MEKVAFQVRQSAPGAKGEERVHPVEEMACAKDLRWEDDCPSKQKANVTEVWGNKEEG